MRSEKWRQVAWFIGLWLAGVGTIYAIAMVIKAAIL